MAKDRVQTDEVEDEQRVIRETLWVEVDTSGKLKGRNIDRQAWEIETSGLSSWISDP